MVSSTVTRRDLMRGGGAIAGASLLRLSLPAAFAAAESARAAQQSGAAYGTLGVAEARELEAIAARILPTTDKPGAREAGVIHFFDTVLGDVMADMLPPLRAGLEPFQQGLGDRFPGATRFSALSEADQDAWLQTRDDTPFFGMVRMLTLLGFFAMSSYGGNRNGVGWSLIGFDGHGTATAPFGYYDAQYMEAAADGE